MNVDAGMGQWSIHELRSVEDIVDGVILCTKFFAERYPNKLFNRNSALSHISLVANTDHTYENAFLVYHHDQPVGFLYATISEEFGLFDKSAWVHMWYVDPDYRSARPSMLLIAAFEDWARQQGAARVYSTVVLDNSTDVEMITQLLMRMGYNHTGNYLVKET